MPAPLEKTNTPGVFKRGSRYAVVYRDAQGKQRQESARTYDEARRLRRRRVASVDDGTHTPQTRAKLADYAREWVERYQGRGRRGFRENTRDDYRRDLERYAFRQLGRLRLEQITPRHIAEFVGWLCDVDAQGERVAEERHAAATAAAVERGEPAPERVDPEPVYLADATIRRVLAPLRACMSSAVAEGLIRHNPTLGIALPARDNQRRIDQGDDLDADEQVKALTEDELAGFMLVCPVAWRPFFELLAVTGLRWSEIIALRRADLQLDGSAPHVKVRRAYVKGKMGEPKSRHARRQVPIDAATVSTLRGLLAKSPDAGRGDLVFATATGAPLDYSNTRRRVLVPAAQEAGVPWVGFHTFRHTCATRLFAAGRNAVQVQRWLGHHSPAFTLSVYVHLLDGDLGEPIGLPLGEHAWKSPTSERVEQHTPS